jgi:hypothetical protein
MIVVRASETLSQLPQTESEVPSDNENHKPGYKNNEVLSNILENLILMNCRRRYQQVYLSALQKLENL